VAIEYVHSTAGGNITVKWIDVGITNEIHVGSAISDLLVQDLLNACRAAEGSSQGLAFGQIARASGKEILGTGVAVGITLELLGTWRIFSTKNSGVFTVLGGNAVKSDGSSPFRPNNQITYVNVLSAASTIVTTGGGGGGSDFTSNDRAALLEIHSGEAPIVEAIRGGIFGTLVDGTITFAAYCRKVIAILRGNAEFDVPANGTNRIRFKNQAGTVEETHEVKSTGRTVT
jgi:hypothetical protein